MKGFAGLMIALTLGALGLVACGEDDQAEVRSVIRLLVDSDPARCDNMTTRYIKNTAGDIKQCKRVARQGAPFRGVKIEEIAVDGDNATATVSHLDTRNSLKLVKQDGDWKIDTVRVVPSEETTKPTASKPKIRRGLGARATVDAYYQAIDDRDGAALCGLLSQRFAVKMRGGKKTASPIADCVEGLANYDWSEVRKSAKGVKSVDVIDPGGVTAAVTISHGRRALLKRHDGRWVIDDIKVTR
jgi:hypothetical protein